MSKKLEIEFLRKQLEEAEYREQSWKNIAEKNEANAVGYQQLFEKAVEEVRQERREKKFLRDLLEEKLTTATFLEFQVILEKVSGYLKQCIEDCPGDKEIRLREEVEYVLAKLR